jgi:hypothetical protein
MSQLTSKYRKTDKVANYKPKDITMRCEAKTLHLMDENGAMVE